MSESAFGNIAVDSAHAFRSIMQAMARPGTSQSVKLNLFAPEPMLSSTAAIALTLCDFQTPVWLGPGFDQSEIQHYIRFHTGAPVVQNPQQALFVFLDCRIEPPDFAFFAKGTQEYPDRSATLILQSTKLGGEAVTLSGPGIPTAIEFDVTGLTRNFWTAWASNHAMFPLGVDAFFTAPDKIAALPRSTAICLKEVA